MTSGCVDPELTDPPMDLVALLSGIDFLPAEVADRLIDAPGVWEVLSADGVDGLELVYASEELDAGGLGLNLVLLVWTGSSARELGL